MNNWLDKLERKFSRYAIPNLITYIIILYAAGFALDLINPTFYSQFLSLDASKILQGQIWRIVTFIIQPPSDSLIFIAFALYLYYMIGKQLEAAWGAFRFNLYFFSGMLFIVLGAAYLAGLAVGYWKNRDEIRENWQIGASFAPEMEEESRKKLLKGWHRAVKCALAWAEDEI